MADGPLPPDGKLPAHIVLADANGDPVDPPADFFEDEPPFPKWNSLEHIVPPPLPAAAIWEFDEAKRRIYLNTLAETGCHAMAARCIAMRVDHIRDVRKKDKLLEADCEEALAYYAAECKHVVRRLGIKGYWKPVIGRNSRGADVIIHWERVHSERFVHMETVRVAPEYNEKRQLDVNVNARVGVMVVRAPALTVEAWEEEMDRATLSINPLDGIPGIDPQMIEDMSSSKRETEE